MIHEKLKYRNHINEEFDFGANDVWISPSDLRDYAWKVNSKNRRIASFSRDITSKKLPVTIVCRSAAEGISVKNRLFEVAEKDVLANRSGRLLFGDSYYRCFITASAKSDYMIDPRHMRADLTVVSDHPVWVRETFYAFRPQVTAGSLDYALDYPYDYLSGDASDQVLNPAFLACAFRLVIYGPAQNPTLYIGGHEYKVLCTVADGEYLTIDSTAKTIILTQNDGTQVNRFSSRSRDQYIFEPIPPGLNAVTWDGDFLFDVILLEERSEPKWT